MNRRHPRARTLFLAVGLLALALGLMGAAASATSQPDYQEENRDMIDRAREQEWYCEQSGGEASAYGHGVGPLSGRYVRMQCGGGLMNGWECLNKIAIEESWCALGLTQPQEPESQEDVPVNVGTPAHEMMSWCENNQGGVVTYIPDDPDFGDGSWTVACDVGGFGSWYCEVNDSHPAKSYCFFDLPNTLDHANVMPEGSIEIPPGEPLETLALSDPFPFPKPRCPIIIHDPLCDDLRVLETPMLIEVMVAPIPAGSNVEATALLSINGCRAAGGNAYASMAGIAVTVICEGGIGDGLWCQVDAWGSMCTICRRWPRRGIPRPPATLRHR